MQGCVREGARVCFCYIILCCCINLWLNYHRSEFNLICSNVLSLILLWKYYFVTLRAGGWGCGMGIWGWEEVGWGRGRMEFACRECGGGPSRRALTRVWRCCTDGTPGHPGRYQDAQVPERYCSLVCGVLNA